MKNNSSWKNINILSNVILWVCGVIFIPFAGLFVYTPEFLKGVKEYLEGNYNFTISRFLFILIIVFLTIIVWTIIKLIAKKILDLEIEFKKIEDECLDLKYKLSQNVNIKIDESKKEKIQQAMENFVKSNNDVISVQIYECMEAKHKNTIKYDIKLANFKYIRDGEYVNDIQECYKVDERKLNKYHEIKKSYLINSDEKAYTNYLKELTERLNKKVKSEISDSVIFDYCCLTLSYQYYFGEDPFEIKDIDNIYQEKINDTKRNGFLRGIIEKDFNKFKHIGRSQKSNRIYITKCLPIENIPHMFVITLYPSVINRKNYSAFIDDIGEKFYNILTNDLKLVYNNYKVV